MYEQHLAILWQGPKFVVDDKFQMVHVVANLLDEGRYGIVVGNSALAAVFNAIGDATCLDEAFHVLDDERVVLAHLLDEAQVCAIQGVGNLGGEDLLHAVHVVDELRLVACGDGYDVVHTDVAEDACLNLNLLNISCPHISWNRKYTPAATIMPAVVIMSLCSELPANMRIEARTQML